MTKIFISYRREDSEWPSHKLRDAILPHLGSPEDLFMDVHSIPIGLDFEVYLGNMVAQCDKLLAVIGPRWLDILKARDTTAQDFVRTEIAAALKRDIPVIPVLIAPATVPAEADLPDDLKPLAKRNAPPPLRASHFEADVRDLIKGLQLAPEAAQPAEQEGPDQRPVFDPNQYVFISHPSSVDPEIVRLVVRGLMKSGMPVWLYEPSAFDFDPKELVSMSWQKAGGSYLNQALEAVRQARCVVMLTGRTTGEGGFQTTELKTALAAGKPMVAAIVDDLPFDELPEGLKDRFVPRIDAEGLKSGRTLPMLVSDIWSAAETPPQPPRKSRTALWAMLGLGLLAATGLGVAWAAGLFAPEADVGRAEARQSTPPASTVGEQPPTLRAGETFRDCDMCPEMVVIPSGSFVMGSPASETGRNDDEGPLRTVQIGYEFAVGKYEVTWAEWEACVADGGCDNAGPLGAGGDNGWGKGNRPVINVSWEDAQAYAEWLSGETGERYRLLSEAEWEYAARGVTTPTAASTRFSWGDGDPVCTRGAAKGGNFIACTSDRTEPVGFSAANALALHDLHGNVWEWTQDCYVDSYSGAPTDGFARIVNDCSRRVLRGGSWGANPRDLRSALRYWGNLAGRFNDVGFRVARTLSPPTP